MRHTSSRCWQVTVSVVRAQWHPSATCSWQGGQAPGWQASGQAWPHAFSFWQDSPHSWHAAHLPSARTSCKTWTAVFALRLKPHTPAQAY